MVGCKHPVISVSVLARRRHEIGEPVEKLKRREVDDAIGPRPRGLAAATGSDPVGFWRYVYSTSTKEFFDQWYAWGVRCRLRPIVRVAKMLKRHLPNLLSYFLYRITNATSEGFNSVIQALKYAARGFRSFKNYRTRIRFYCGRLALRPQLPCH